MEHLRLISTMGGKVIIPESICPCANSKLALCADDEGNQFIIKEPTRSLCQRHILRRYWKDRVVADVLISEQQ